MQTCPTHEELRAFLAEELAEEARRALENHVETCTACQAHLERVSRAEGLTVVLRRPSDVSTSEPALARFLAGLETRRPGADLAGEVRFPGLPTPEAPLGVVGIYQILEKIGEGGGGFVYRARDARLEREVALKVLRQDLAPLARERARFEREARILGGLRHDSIVEVFDIVWPENFPPYLVLELVPGESLSRRLARSGPWPAEQAAGLVELLAHALAFAHDRGLVHRDVKPANILLEPYTDRPKLTDFGLARLVADAGDLTQTGVLVGTPTYMSPEQVTHPETVDGRSDVYSLGIVLYELLAGAPPFRGVPRMILNQVLHEDPRPPRQLNDRIPRDLETICLKAIRKEPTQRYADARAFAEDLRRWREGLPILGRPLGPLQRWGRWVRRNPRVARLTALATVLMGAWIVGQTVAYFDLRRANLHIRRSQERAERLARFAGEQRDLALESLLGLVFETQDKLQDRPGLEPLRAALLHQAIEGLTKAAQAGERTGEIDQGMLVAHQRLGDALMMLGRTAEAERHLRTSLEMAQSLLERTPRATEIRKAQATSWWRLGDVAAHEGRSEQAEMAYDRALAVCESLMDDAEAWARRALVLVCDRRGNHAAQCQRWSDAAAWYERARVHITAGELEAAQLELKLARAYQQRGDPGRAEASLTAAQSMVSRLAPASAISQDALRLAAAVEAGWAELDRSRDRLDAARLRAARADGQLARLLEGSPRPAELLRDRALVQMILGICADGKREPARAREHFRQCWQLRQELAGRPDAALADQKELLVAIRLLLRAEAAAGNASQADHWVREGTDTLARLDRTGASATLKSWIEQERRDLIFLRKKLSPF